MDTKIEKELLCSSYPCMSPARAVLSHMLCVPFAQATARCVVQGRGHKGQAGRALAEDGGEGEDDQSERSFWASVMLNPPM